MNNRQLFFNHLGQTSPFPLALEIERAEGCYMYGVNGEKYLDLISGIAVSNVGHCHPKVVAAINAQVARHMHLMVYGEVIQSPQVKLAAKIASLLGIAENTSVYLVNSGSEAVEGAMKLAKRYTGRTKILSCVNAYHGSSQGALSIMGSEMFKSAFRPLLPDTYTIRFGNLDDLKLIDKHTAALFIEPIQGEAGVRIAEEGYYLALQARCNEVGALLVADEIQTGFGRTGKWFAYQHFGLKPDVVLMAKGMGGGMPIGAFAAAKAIMDVLTHQPILGHITTFGGHPVSAAAALACIQVIEEENLVLNARNLGAYLATLSWHPAIQQVRGIGLMQALELDSFDLVMKLIEKCLQQGVFTDWFLFCDNSVRIAPPLISSASDLLYANQVINHSLTLITN